MDPEQRRIEDADLNRAPWKKWGPYLSERQWGTVREDYSRDGTAWDYFSHDQARSRAYHWGEDGIAGISDDHQFLCFALAFWNGKDPILKERMFGLTNGEGNHGEDCKEYYFYLDNTPSHSWMKYLYKYPQSAYPYTNLVEGNRARSRNQLEYELLDTGAFNEDRYFDIFIECAKESPEDILITVTAWNRGPDPVPLHVLPTLWFRNTWAWGREQTRPSLTAAALSPELSAVKATHRILGERYLYCSGGPELLFADNETNTSRLFNTPNHTPYQKDGIGRFIISREGGAINPAKSGTKSSAHYVLEIDPGKSAVVQVRLTNSAPGQLEARYPGADPFGVHFRDIGRLRLLEADRFYGDILPANLDDDQRNVMRQALAGMLWSKQYYEYDVGLWLNEHNVTENGGAVSIRNQQWYHMVNSDIISMPDKWEYPWYAAWDLALHTLPLGIVDPAFAKAQLELMLRDRYQHPNGQLPAYEWNFSDVNPPVHAWACIFSHRFRREISGQADYSFLLRAFPKLLTNFTWWVNRKDSIGANVFSGGFLGLDNIGVFDRSAPLPGGGTLEQADGTAWMALYAQNMFEIAVELAPIDCSWEESACKFFEHFIWIASAMNRSYASRKECGTRKTAFSTICSAIPTVIP